MSFWSRIGITIEDVECFKQSCRQNGIEYEKLNEEEQLREHGVDAIAKITDKEGPGWGLLVRTEGAVKLRFRVGGTYNSITRRLGPNGGKLGRDYTEMVIRKEMRKQGGMVSKAVEQKDGGLLLQIAVSA